jgi:hypothetical protein
MQTDRCCVRGVETEIARATPATLIVLLVPSCVNGGWHCVERVRFLAPFNESHTVLVEPTITQERNGLMGTFKIIVSALKPNVAQLIAFGAALKL